MIAREQTQIHLSDSRRADLHQTSAVSGHSFFWRAYDFR